ncbi:MAG: SpoVA/SpoVAEb family sporulation membrane protein [Ruminococcus sp.]|jgi:stage V sporulation protein AE|nr:SpoVA/SpoVAEb family sporulation membrane protein [Ruminococcus sp.]
MDYVIAFITGGFICVIGQLLIDKTSLTPARILTGFTVAGVILTALGLYKPFVDFAGQGATVPISGFGYLMASGVEKAVNENGAVGIITGALTAAAGGICAAVSGSVIAGLLSKSKEK